MPSEEMEETRHVDPRHQISLELHPKWMFWKKRRYIVALFACVGFFAIFTLRANMGIALVAMTEEKNVTLDNGSIILNREFEWDSETQGYVLGSFFYGFITTVFFGGWVSVKVGGKKVFAATVGMSGFVNLLTPPSATASVYLLILMRIIYGMFEGAVLPCVQAVLSKWAPPFERSKLSIIGFSGSYVSWIVATPVNGYLVTLWGWPSIFYISGTLNVIWAIAWYYYIAESPADDPRITKEELEYIQKSLGNYGIINHNLKVPFGKILTSAPVWAIAVAHFIDMWVSFILLFQLPMFIKDKFGLDLDKIGYLSGLPFIPMGLCALISALFADYLQQKDCLTTTQVRKCITCSIFALSSILMVAIVHVTTTAGTVVCLILAVSVGACAWSGYGVNYLEVAPKFASVLMGLGHTFGTIAGICCPIVTGQIVKTQSLHEWRIVFYIAAVLRAIGSVQYAIFASGEAQPWATTEES